MKGFYWSFKN